MAEKAGLLAPHHYDDDAVDADSDHEIHSDEDSEHGRNTLELAEQDRELLREDEEREELLVGSSQQGPWKKMFNRKKGDGKKARQLEKRERRSSNRRRRREEESELMYEMEEGGQVSTAESRSSSESDLQRIGELHGEKKARRRLRFGRLAIHFAIILLFLVLLFGAYKATTETRPKNALLALSNGTTIFAPTTILISLDGFRADFLKRGLTPTLNAFVQEGVSPLYMLPSFPSVTFPNHYTMVTGLYPESHGIVGNTFWDPEIKEEFYYTHPDSMQPKWWGGEPLWVTAENQGMRTAVHMWPGSEAHIAGVEPSHLDKYNGTEELDLKVQRIFELIDLPGPDSAQAMMDKPRPQLIAAYVPNVDADGHKYGPNSTEIKQTIQNVDTMLADIFEGLTARNLTNIVNVVVVSDHGMATTDTTRLIQLEDLIDTELVEHTDGWPLFGLRPKTLDRLEDMYKQLKKAAETNPYYDVYLRDEDMPERYHFSKHPRIAPLWIVPKAGWAIVQKHEFDLAQALKDGTVYHPRGLHGYDHEHPLMRAIFVARGPAFPHKAGSRVEVFQNIEVYNIICDSIGVEPIANNGTLRLPLKPVGLHSDPKAPIADVPDDLPADAASAASKAHSPSSVPTPVEQPTLPILKSSSVPVPVASKPPPSPSMPPSPSKPSAAPSQAAEPSPSATPADDEKPHTLAGWWEWLSGKLDDAKDWAQGLVDKNHSK
ncbi:Phosphodiest-domain-containing protein [Aulographum hederae CBS 113979]|uniref:Phosphodiest-domain-containing protein n=1 Tax=Aulographum hederae CBS 113979 TaxID=1176131 RepID=A0A6G1HGE9_9PEZI|nr:Phosphodiest-domain-containing protein [Aulographum hederae CBS 113979]